MALLGALIADSWVARSSARKRRLQPTGSFARQAYCSRSKRGRRLSSGSPLNGSGIYTALIFQLAYSFFKNTGLQMDFVEGIKKAAEAELAELKEKLAISP